MTSQSNPADVNDSRSANIKRRRLARITIYLHVIAAIATVAVGLSEYHHYGDFWIKVCILFTIPLVILMYVMPLMVMVTHIRARASGFQIVIATIASIALSFVQCFGLLPLVS